jgi:hypothetical protein
MNVLMFCFQLQTSILLFFYVFSFLFCKNLVLLAIFAETHFLQGVGMLHI